MASIPEIYSLPDTFSNLEEICSDQEIISILRKSREAFIQIRGQDFEHKVVRFPYPGRKRYLVHHDSESMEGWKTDDGTWSPKKLVSIPSTSQGNSANSPKFVGTKTTMEFKPTDGSKAVVGMTRYNLLTTREDGDGLDLDEEMSLCHVFPLEEKVKPSRNRNIKRRRSESAADHCNDVVLPPLDELDQDTSKVDVTEFSPLDVDDYGVDVQDLLFADPSKSEPSKFWQSFTKIYTKNPKLMYAACNHCDTMLKLTSRRGAASSCGTGSLKRHTEACKPKQEQLPGNSSSLPIPSTALQAIAEQLELV